MVARFVTMRAPMVLLLILAIPAGAQLPPGASLLGGADVADSQAVLASLRDAIRANRNDGAAWYRQGMVAWALAVRAESEPRIRGLDPMRLHRHADSSLRIAAQIEPGNARYQLSTGLYLRSRPGPTLRLAAEAFFDGAAAAARGGADSARWTQAVIEAGRTRWLRYDTHAHRALGCDGLASSIDVAAGGANTASIPYSTELALKRLQSLLRDCQQPPPDLALRDYEEAEALFREALSVAPDDPRVFRHVAMLLADRGRWQELDVIARERSVRLPSEGWAFLARALALHRSGASARASAIADSGIARLDENERGRLFAMGRVLAPPDSAALARMSSADRLAREAALWAMADPLWSRDGNDARIEFLARVTFAELRWTVDELGVRGADSDRGHALIRYGPPQTVYVFRGCDFFTIPTACADGPAGARPAFTSVGPNRSDIVTYWDYDIGLTLVFWGAPAYGSAHYPIVDAPHIARVVELQPASFANVAVERIVAMASQVTRFRAPGDSVDVVLFTQAPLGDIRSQGGANSPVNARFWIVPVGAAPGAGDAATLGASGAARWVERVASGRYWLRAEATADGSMIAARVQSHIVAERDTATGFGARGFGMSDLLLAASAAPATSAVTSWEDVNVIPAFGYARHRGTLDLVWETYDVQPRGNRARYGVAITLRRERSTSGRIAAAVVGALASAVRVERRNDRVIMRFDREVAGASTIVDHVSLSLGDTPPGDYTIVVEVTDQTTRQQTSMSAPLTVGPPDSRQ